MKRQLLSGPYLLWMAIFTIIPLVIVLYYAFTDSITGAFTLKNIASRVPICPSSCGAFGFPSSPPSSAWWWVIR